MDIREAVSALMRLRAEIELAGAAGVHAAAEVIAEEAKAWIGHHHTDWPELAELTKKEKARLGYNQGPLERTGALKDSIQVRSQGLHAKVGTDLDYAVYQEHGTSKMPPRPFLSSALTVKKAEAVEAIRLALMKAIKG